MAKQIQFRRGTEQEHSTFVGAVGEITVNTTDNRLSVHDGVTAGGHPTAKESEVLVKADKIPTAIVNNFTSFDTTGNIKDSGYTSSSFLTPTNNLSDITYPQTARTNLGLGTAATKDVGELESLIASANHNHSSLLFNDADVKIAAISSGVIVSGNINFTSDGDMMIFGSGADAQMFHDGLNLYLNNESGNIYISSPNTGVPAIIVVPNAETTLGYNGSIKLSTSNTGVNVTGDVTATTFIGDLTGNASTSTDADTLDTYHASSFSLTTHNHNLADLTEKSYTSLVDVPSTFAPSTHNNTDHSETYITASAVTYENLSTNLDIGTGATQVSQGDHNHDTDYLSATGTAVDSSALETFTSSQFIRSDVDGDVSGHTEWQDSKEVRFGTDGDASIVHSGTSFNITNTTGNTNIFANATDVGIGIVPDGAVNLYYDNSLKLVTSSAGVIVTGTMTADATKLDDSGTAQFGTDNDLRIFHNGTNGFIDNDTGTLYLRSDIVSVEDAAGAETLGKFTSNGSVDLYYDNTVKFATTTNGINVTGSITNSGSLYTGGGIELCAQDTGNRHSLIDFHSNDTDADFAARIIRAAGVDTDLDLVNIGSGSIRLYVNSNEAAITCAANGAVDLYYDNSLKLATTTTGATLTGILDADGLDLDDNEYIYFGDGNTAAIKHDGANFIFSNATGSTVIQDATSFFVQTPAGETSIGAYANGKVDLYYDNSLKLATSSTGISVTGTIITDALSLGSSEKLLLGNSSGDIMHSGAGGHLYVSNTVGNMYFRPTGTEVGISIIPNGNVSLYYDNVARFNTTNGGVKISTANNQLDMNQGQVLYHEAGGGSTQTVSGDIVSMTVGEAVVFGSFLYMNSDEKLWKSDASASTTMPCMAMAIQTASADAECQVLLRGFARDDTWTWTVGGTLYTSITSGAASNSTPSTTGEQIQGLGVATHATRIYFNPDVVCGEVA